MFASDKPPANSARASENRGRIAEQNHEETVRSKESTIKSFQCKNCRWVHILLFRPCLYEQQAGDANLFPGSTVEEGLELQSGSWKCGFHFPEQGVGIRLVVVRCRLSNQIIKPLSLLVCECDGLIAGTPW
jgi:hypothetical protein